MDLLMGAHQETDCRATPSGSPITRSYMGVGVQDPQQSTVTANWYAVYTSANHEKRVAEQFAVRGIEHFFPQYESVRKWKDRRKCLQLPLFPGYVFVQIELTKRLCVLQVPGVARLVGFDGQPAPVPEGDLRRVREFLAQGFRAEPHRILKVGRRVRVKGGPLVGMEGIVARRKNGHKLVISFDLIQQAVAVEIAGEYLEGL
jgi:transcription antitermination factor NusG